MATAKVSPKYQIVIPLEVRRALDIRPGQQIQVIPFDGRIELVLLRPLREARGLLRGIDTHIDRESDRP